MAISSDNNINKKGFISKLVGNLIKPFTKQKKYQPQSLEELKTLVRNNSIKLSQIDVSKVNSFEELFKDSTRTDFEGIESWNTSHVTNMRKMFYNCKNFNSDISNWDMSNVSAMSMMFNGAKNFNQDLSGWDLSGMKGHLNGKFLGNMFRFAEKMNKRIFDRYHELEKQNVPIEERFNHLPIPKPKDFKKYIIPANFSNDIKEIFEKVNFDDLDTSAVESLDGALENSERKNFSNFDTLDFSMVKTADNFLSYAEAFNSPIPDIENVKYANNMLNGAYSYNQNLPSMPEIKQMNNFLDNNKNYQGNIHSSMSDASPVSAKKAFSSVDKTHLDKELNNIGFNNAVKQEQIEQKFISLLGKKFDNQDDFLSKQKEIDPNDEFMVFCVSAENKSKIEKVCPGMLSVPLKDDTDFYNCFESDSFIVKKSDYKKLCDSNITISNPYTLKEDNITNNSVAFSLSDYNKNFGYYRSNVGLDKFAGVRGNLSMRDHFAMFKGVEYHCNHPEKSNYDCIKYSNAITVDRLNKLIERDPKSGSLCADYLKDLSQNTDKMFSYKNGIFNRRHFGEDLVANPNSKNLANEYREILITDLKPENSQLNTQVKLASDKTLVNMFEIKQCIYDITNNLTSNQNAESHELINGCSAVTCLFSESFGGNLTSTPKALIESLSKVSTGLEFNRNLDLWDFKNESKIICEKAENKLLNKNIKTNVTKQHKQPSLKESNTKKSKGITH